MATVISQNNEKQHTGHSQIHIYVRVFSDSIQVNFSVKTHTHKNPGFHLTLNIMNGVLTVLIY